MDGFGIDTYGERIADAYDDRYRGALADPAVTAAVLAELAGPGRRALELAIGTGRIALPLAALGVDVTGIDASPAMVERLRAKPGGDAIPVVLGDMADVPVEGAWPLVYIAFNTFFALTTQDAQVRCFEQVARHLEPGGAFVIEGFVPDLTRWQGGTNTRPITLELDRVLFDLSMHDPVAQRVTTQHVELSAAGTRLDPVVLRYAFPSELDLMARIAGLRLRHRWGGWDRSPFDASSTRHVSVYEAAAR